MLHSLSIHQRIQPTEGPMVRTPWKLCAPEAVLTLAAHCEGLVFHHDQGFAGLYLTSISISARRHRSLKKDNSILDLLRCV